MFTKENAPPPKEVMGVVNGKLFKATHVRKGVYEITDIAPPKQEVDKKEEV